MYHGGPRATYVNGSLVIYVSVGPGIVGPGISLMKIILFSSPYTTHAF